MPAWVPLLVLVLTVGQLAVAEFVPGIDRFAGKAFGARLFAYPVLMLTAPLVWWVVARWRGRLQVDRPPYGAFTLVMLGFLVDVTGNSLDLYDAVIWWDDANHLVNWFFLLTGLGLLLGVSGRRTSVWPGWASVLVVTGLGSLLALAWELGEWWTFIRHGTEQATAYVDTLGDQVLGSTGALLAGLVLAVMPGRHDASTGDQGPRPSRSPRAVVSGRLLVPAALWLTMVALLVVAALTPGHFGDPAAPYRLLAYPVLALVLPVGWLASRTDRALPALATSLVVAPFLVDTVGNVGDLYARISWWDDVNHVGNWFLLCGGIGLAVAHRVRPRWAAVVVVVGLGALFALAWEVGEWAYFYDPPYRVSLYEDTLADQVLGTSGALAAAVLVAWRWAPREITSTARSSSP